MANFKISADYLNQMDAQRSILSGNTFLKESGLYKDSIWELSAKDGSLDQYVAQLNIVAENANKDLFDRLKTDYDMEYADDETTKLALYNETLADKTNIDEERTNNIYDAMGNVTGKETYKASDYDYYKNVIKQRNDYNKQVYIAEQERVRKSQMNAFVKHLADVGGLVGEAATGLFNQIDGLTAFVGSAIDAGIAGLNGKDMADAYVKSNASDDRRLFETLGFQDAIIDWEAKYSHLRDTNGNYTDAGKYLGGICTTLGQMLPSMFLGGKIGNLAGSLGASAQTVKGVSEIASSVIFYAPMTSDNIRDMYIKNAANSVSVPSAQIIANAYVKSFMQYGVEKMLGSILGNTAIDSAVFGRTSKSIAGTSLTKAGLRRLGKDFVQEGLEEVLQDTSDFLVDAASKMLNKDFGTTSDLSVQGLIDAFLIGGLTSFAGSAFNILKTRRGDFDNKIAAWEYGLDMESFVSNYSQIINITKLSSDKKAENKEQLTEAFTELYSSFRMLSSIYTEIGEDRFTVANSILSKITEMINNKTYDFSESRTLATNLYNQLDFLHTEQIKLDVKKELDKVAKENEKETKKVVEKSKEELKKAEELEDVEIKDLQTEIDKVVEKKKRKKSTKKKVDEKTNAKETIDKLVDAEVTEVLTVHNEDTDDAVAKKCLDIDPDIDAVVETKDGNKPVVINDTLFVPTNYKDVGAGTIYQTLAEQRLVEMTVKGKYKDFALQNVLNKFIRAYGRPDATVEEAVYNLYFNEAFFNIMLTSADRDMYQFLVSLYENVIDTKAETVKDKIYNDKVKTVINSMRKAVYKYCLTHEKANIYISLLTDLQRKKIATFRWLARVDGRLSNVTFDELTDEEQKIIRSRVNALPITDNEKTQYLKELNSPNDDVRLGYLKSINNYYKFDDIFDIKYDNVTYAYEDTLGNIVLNAFLHENGLTLAALQDDGVVDAFGVYCNNEYVVKNECGYIYTEDNVKSPYVYDDYALDDFISYDAENASATYPTVKKYLKNFLNEDVDTATANYLTITDVIVNPSLLKKELRDEIKSEFESLSPAAVYRKLRELTFTNSRYSASIILNKDGTYSFVSLKYANKSLREDFKIEDLLKSKNKSTPASKIFKDKFLQGSLNDLVIKFINTKDGSGYYIPSKHAIFISKNVTNENECLTILLHEFQHAVQEEYGFNKGFSAKIILAMDEIEQDFVVNDVFKHVPNLKKDFDKRVARGVEKAENAASFVADYIYRNTGEFQAFGKEQWVRSDTTHPFVATGDSIITPWGMTYDVSYIGNNTKLMADTNKKDSQDKTNKKDAQDKQTPTKRTRNTTKFSSRGKEKVKRVYPSQKAYAGTNLEKWGYTGKYYRGMRTKEFIDFVNSYDGDYLPTHFEKKLKSGELTFKDITSLLLTNEQEERNQETFDLLNKTVFKNEYIKSFEQLDQIVENSAEYYALRAVAKKFKFTELLSREITPETKDLFVAVISKNENMYKLYEDVKNNYDVHVIGKSSAEDLTLPTNYMKLRYMQNYDGTLQGAGGVAAAGKIIAYNHYISVHDAKAASSLQDTVGDDMSLEDVVAGDNNFDDYFDNDFPTSYDEMERKIIDIVTPTIKENAVKYINENKKKIVEKYNLKTNDDLKRYASKLLKSRLDKQIEAIKNLSNSDLITIYLREVEHKTDEEIREYFIFHDFMMVDGLLKSMPNKEAIENLKATAKITAKNARDNKAILAAIKRRIPNIRKYLITNASKKLFLQENSDIFNNDFTLKDEVIHETDIKGRVRVKSDTKAMLELEKRIADIVQNARNNYYENKKKRDEIERLKKENAKLKAKNEKLVINKANEKALGKVKTSTITVSDTKIEIDTTVKVPVSLQNILANNFTGTAKTYVKYGNSVDEEGKSIYFSKLDEHHVKMDFNQFVKDNSELLKNLTQTDIDEIIDFYTHSQIIPETNKVRQYLGTQIYMMAYILSNHKSGRYLLTTEQYDSVSERLTSISSVSGAALRTVYNALDKLTPEQKLIEVMAFKFGIEFEKEDVETLVSAVYSGNSETVKKAKQIMFDNAVKTYEGDKQTIFDKLLKFERAAMLSSPGTWLRNKASNVIVEHAGNLADFVQKPVTDLLQRVFPKKFKKPDNQFKFVGTQVTQDVVNHIKEFYVDNGLFDLVKDGLSKYDTRKYNTGDNTSEDSIVGAIEASIKNLIFENTLKMGKGENKLSDKFDTVCGYVFKMMSDEKSIQKATLKYFGKMLAETKSDISNGLTVQNMNMFADAYVLAANEYMHKVNIFTKLDRLVKAKGSGWYFMYKQFLPFAAASYNWLLEGLNYTPVGLCKAIYDMAKLENTITKIEDAKQKGEQVVSSRFQEYLVKKRIGKGMIGVVTTLIGLGLAALGWAGIDEEDDKFVLKVGDARLDITNVFGTQGILMGIAIASPEKGDFVSVLENFANVCLMDSTISEMWNTFRWNENVGEYIVNDVPYAIVSSFVPNILKSVSNVINVNKVQYSPGILGQFERILGQTIPGVVYALPKRHDPYTGENQLKYKTAFAEPGNNAVNILGTFFTNITSMLSPMKVYSYNVSDYEKEALSLQIHKTSLKGTYTIDGRKINLSSKKVADLNEYYGRLNNAELGKLFGNKIAYRVLDKKKNKYVELKYNKMTDEQKKTVIDRIMTNNGIQAKVFIMTNNGYKYYATEEQWKTYRKAGIKNVYIKTKKYDGFVKA